MKVKKSIEEGMNITTNSEINFNDLVDEIKSGKLISFATGWNRHATGLAIKDGVLAYANRGKGLNKGQKGIVLYRIKSMENLTGELLRKLVECQKESIEDRMIFLEGLEDQVDSKGNPSLAKILNLKKILKIRKKSQKVRNCTWTSAKCVFEAGLILNDISSIEKKGIPITKSQLKTIATHSRLLFKRFDIHHKMNALNNFMEFLNDHNKNHEFLSSANEFLLYTLFLQKFSSAYILKISENKKEIDKIRALILEKTMSTSISNAIIPMNTISRRRANVAGRFAVVKEFSKIKLDNEDQIIQSNTRKAEKRNRPGAFALIADKEGLQLHYCMDPTVYLNETTKISPQVATQISLTIDHDHQGFFYRIAEEQEKLRTIKDISNYLRERCILHRTHYKAELPIPYPVTVQKNKAAKGLIQKFL